MMRGKKVHADVDQHITELFRLEKPCKIKSSHKPSIAKPTTKPSPSDPSTHLLNPSILLLSSCWSTVIGRCSGVQWPLKPPLHKLQTYSRAPEALSHDKHPIIPTKIRGCDTFGSRDPLTGSRTGTRWICSLWNFPPAGPSRSWCQDQFFLSYFHCAGWNWNQKTAVAWAEPLNILMAFPSETSSLLWVQKLRGRGPW